MKKILGMILIILFSVGVVFADDVITKMDDNSIQIVSTTTNIISITSLLAQQKAWQERVNFDQGNLDKVNTQLSQASLLGVTSAVTASQKKTTQ